MIITRHQIWLERDTVFRDCVIPYSCDLRYSIVSVICDIVTYDIIWMLVFQGLAMFVLFGWGALEARGGQLGRWTGWVLEERIVVGSRRFELDGYHSKLVLRSLLIGWGRIGT